MRILVTGFGGFPGAPRNPTERIIANLARHRPRLARAGLELDLNVLPVVYAEIGPRLEALTREGTPDAILHFGLASRRTKISVEMRALNCVSLLRPDAAGAYPQRRSLTAKASQIPADAAQAPSGACEQIPSDESEALLGPKQRDALRSGAKSASGGSQILKASAPAALIAARLRCGGVPAVVSIDAGDYVCNVTLFCSLSRYPDALVGFIHVPALAALRPQPVSYSFKRRAHPFRQRAPDADPLASLRRPRGAADRSGGPKRPVPKERRLDFDEAARAAILAILALIPKLRLRRLSRSDVST